MTTDIVYTCALSDIPQGDLAAIERALYPMRTARDECHRCGAPSPGDVCRYCNTVLRRTTT